MTVINGASSLAELIASATLPMEEAVGSRRLLLLDHRGAVLQVLTGYADVFAVEVKDNKCGTRHHLFRVDSGDIILDLPRVSVAPDNALCFIAVGSDGARIALFSRDDPTALDLAMRWVERTARFIAGFAPEWQMPELPESEGELSTGERRRGPMRGLLWLTVMRGSVTLMSTGAPWEAGTCPLPLTSALWVEAGHEGCTVRCATDRPAGDLVWQSIDQFHLRFVACVQDILAHDLRFESERLADRTKISALKTIDAFDRLSGIVARRFEHQGLDLTTSDRLTGACQIVGNAMRTPIAVTRVGSGRQDSAALAQIAETARLRPRSVLLRPGWWTLDAGPLVAWHSENRDAVALICEPGRGYVMVDPLTKEKRPVNPSLAAEIAPDAVAFYPPLPSQSLKFRDLLQFALHHSKGNGFRIVLGVILIGLLSLVTPFITDILIGSVIPRSELDQLAYCALALGLTALSTAGIQVMQGLAMLRMEATIDWRLQAAMIDRLLRLPTSIFRDFTAGDLVDRSMGIDTARRALTGRALRGLIAGLFCVFSLGLMIYYNLKLALIAIGLIAVRALAIIGTNLIRLHFEGKHFNQQGIVNGFVLQLLTGVAKLRVSLATSRALAIWSRKFATQKQFFVSSQAASNGLAAFETAFPTIATLIIFAYAFYSDNQLMQDIGSFFAFFSAFGQTLGSVGAWAAGISEALIAIPPLRRLRPLIASPTEVSDDRKSPGELSGSFELARVSLRYIVNGPLALDNVSLKVAPGEYVAIVGPSGSGKSSLFRLLLGFERPESGAVFYDGKSVETLDVSTVRRQLGVVLQNAKLTNGTIYENICGGIRLPLDQVWEAARLVGIEDDIKAMPMGMLTQLAEGINTLSGGQRQRIMIARAIARRPRILLFDEATSALDNRSQAIVGHALENLNVTRVVIAHRLSTVQRADRIVVLVNGKIVQQGTFSELSATPGMFASFAERQLV